MTNPNSSINAIESLHNYSNGLTKREYIATSVLNGLISAWGQHCVTDYNDLAHDAVRAADALINALNQQGETNNG